MLLRYFNTIECIALQNIKRILKWLTQETLITYFEIHDYYLYKSNPIRMYQNIDNAQFKQLMTQPNTIVIDVRTPKEVGEGYISGTQVFADINNPEEFEKDLKHFDKSKNYLRTPLKTHNYENNFTHGEVES